MACQKMGKDSNCRTALLPGYFCIKSLLLTALIMVMMPIAINLHGEDSKGSEEVEFVS